MYKGKWAREGGLTGFSELIVWDVRGAEVRKKEEGMSKMQLDMN